MSRIEKLSKLIASKFSKKLSIDEDHEEVVAYGAFAFLQTFISIFAVFVFGIIFDVLLEVLVISFSAATLRKFSGGAHATTPMSCVLIGMFVFGGLALAVKHLIIKIDFIYLIFITTAAFLFAFYIMINYSPVGSVNKPLKNELKRKRLKNQSLKCVSFLLVLNIIFFIIYIWTNNFYLLSLSISITTGVVWQSITLVSLGHYIIEKLDKLFKDTNTW